MAEKKKKRYGLWFVVILLLVGLAGFGAGGFSHNIRSLGTVGDKEVSLTDYQNALNEQIQAISAQFGTAISFQQAQQFGIDQAALSQIILARSLDNEATNLGISAGDATVLERLQQIPQFRGASGAFNRDTYRLALQQTGQNETTFEDSLREDIARTLLQGAIVGGVPTNEAYADTLMQYVGEQRTISWALVDAEALTAPIPGATEADQQAYYDENPEAFTLPETRDITYVWLTPDMILDQLTVNETQIEALYQDRIDVFLQPERRLVERLVYINAADAEAAKARLDAGELTFDELVEERGLSLADIDLGDRDQDSLGDAGEPIFAAGVGDVVGPFNSGLGPALFRMNAVLAAQETTLEQATPALTQELATTAARDVINDRTDEIIDLLAGGASMEDIAERTDMELGTINWTADLAEGIAAYDGFRQAAATVQEGAFAEVEDLADGGIFALRLDGVTPPTVQPIDEIREAVQEAWQVQARQDAVIAKAEEMAKSIDSLTGFDIVDLEPTVEENMTRRTFIEGTPPNFNDTVFGLDVGEVQVVDAENRAIIVRLDSVAPPDPEAEGTIAQREQFAETAAAGIAQDIFDAYATILQEQTDINIDQATVNAVNAGFQ